MFDAVWMIVDGKAQWVYCNEQKTTPEKEIVPIEVPKLTAEASEYWG